VRLWGVANALLEGPLGPDLLGDGVEIFTPGLAKLNLPIRVGSERIDKSEVRQRR